MEFYTVYEVLSDLDNKKMAEYIANKLGDSHIEPWIATIEDFKSLSPKDSGMSIADMILVDDDSNPLDVVYSNEVVAYSRGDKTIEYFEIDDEDWGKVLGMTISHSSFQNLLPHEIIGDIIITLTRKHHVSPAEPKLKPITESSFTIPKSLVYAACGTKDDRTILEKTSDAFDSAFTYQKVRKLLDKYIGEAG